MYMPKRPKDHGQKDRGLRLLTTDFEWAIYQLEAEREKAELASVVIPSSTTRAVQTIHHSKQHPSYITLPVISR